MEGVTPRSVAPIMVHTFRISAPTPLIATRIQTIITAIQWMVVRLLAVSSQSYSASFSGLFSVSDRED